ncbi:MAG: hypothetical protein MR371_07900 [Clostridia bacterium]|nr:hypothetical protein [Clostridia bacterium]
MLHFLKILGAEGDFLSLQCREGDVQIDLKECAKNAARELGFPDTHCVADRDVTAFEFIFYTEPKTILRIRRGIFERLSYAHFCELDRAVRRCGYSTRDLS